MIGYILRRLVSAVLVLIVTSMAVFALFTWGPSNPAQSICPLPHCTVQTQASIKKSLGLDDPITTQYAEYVQGVFVGRTIHKGSADLDCPAPCFGYSFISNEPVRSFLLQKIPATFSIAIGGSILYFVIGVSIGVYCARRRGTAADRTAIGVSLVVNGVPFYLFALVAWLLLIEQWGIFPNSGYYPLTQNPIDWFKGLILVWLVLAVTNSASYTRFSRGSMIEALSEDYVRTAKAKGLTQRRVTYKHALRAAIAPVITIFGLDFSTLLSGTIFAEVIFGINGLGKATLRSIGQGDLPVVLATTLFAAALIVLGNLIVDLLYSAIDPRVRLV